MCPLVTVHFLSGLGIEEGDFSGFVAGEDEGGDVGKGTNDSFAAGGVEEGRRF